LRTVRWDELGVSSALVCKTWRRTRRDFGSIDLQTASAVHGRRLAELDVATALHSGRPGDVLIASERSRATTTRIVHLKPPADPAEADMLSTLRLSLVAAREARSAQDVAAEATHRQQAAGLQQRLRGRSWTSEGSGQAVAVATLAEIRAKVAELDARLLVYVESNSRLFAVCVGHGPSTLVEIGAADEAIRLARRIHADFDVLALDRLPGPLCAQLNRRCVPICAGSTNFCSRGCGSPEAR
jgi:hypothetical protein